jgi:hypothetical protein
MESINASLQGGRLSEGSEVDSYEKQHRTLCGRNPNEVEKKQNPMRPALWFR